MNVLFLTTHLNPGGITSYLLSLSKALMASGNHVFVASSGGSFQGEFEAMGAQVLVLDIKTKSELNPKIYWALKKLRSWCREKDIDIVHAHTRITQVMAAILCRN